MTGPRIVTLDIETTPILARVWRLREENIGSAQIVEPSRLLCLGWQWHDRARPSFASEWREGHQAMVERAWDLLDRADIVVHYNGARFDVPRLYTEFVQAGLPRPAPFQQVDLYRAVRSTFGFASNRLEFVTGTHALRLEESKIRVDMSLWNDVLAGDDRARRAMRRYCQRDVAITRDLYNRILPWIDRHPNVALYAGDDLARCTTCGSAKLTKHGFSYTGAGTFQRYRCASCGRTCRSAKRDATTPMREAVT